MAELSRTGALLAAVLAGALASVAAAQPEQNRARPIPGPYVLPVAPAHSAAEPPRAAAPATGSMPVPYWMRAPSGPAGSAGGAPSGARPGSVVQAPGVFPPSAAEAAQNAPAQSFFRGYPGVPGQPAGAAQPAYPYGGQPFPAQPYGAPAYGGQPFPAQPGWGWPPAPGGVQPQGGWPAPGWGGAGWPQPFGFGQ